MINFENIKMNVIDKMVLFLYECYEILLKNCNDNKKEKIFINVLI